jgi:hypothetical protein
MKPKNFPDRVRNRRYQAAMRKAKNGSDKTAKEASASAIAIMAGPV